MFTYIFQKSHKNIYLYFLGKKKSQILWWQYQKVDKFHEHTQVQTSGWAMMCTSEDMIMKMVIINFVVLAGI